MYRPKIAIIFGGCSPEYEVSLESAYGVITNIDYDQYEPVLLGISRAGEWFLFTGAPEKILNDTWNNKNDCMTAFLSPARDTHGVVVFKPDNSGHINIIIIDAAMPVLHGKNGEDGTVQGLLELAGIPVIGCGTLASALCMDKNRAHLVAESAGIAVPRAFTLNKTFTSRTIGIGETIQWRNHVRGFFIQAEDIGYPLFVKPVKGGSSLGISKVVCKEDLIEAIWLAFDYDDEVIVEECIDGIEIGCAVIGESDLIVGEVDEIEIPGGFFDFKEKYTLENSAIHVPARIEKEKAEEAKAAAVMIYKALGCSGFARVDMFLTKTGKIIFNEVNTIPGFTAHSRFPSMLGAIGLSFRQVVNTVIGSAFNKVPEISIHHEKDIAS